jgi:hypothetical protein
LKEAAATGCPEAGQTVCRRSLQADSGRHAAAEDRRRKKGSASMPGVRAVFVHCTDGADRRDDVVGNVTSVAGSNRVTIGSGLISRLDAPLRDLRIVQMCGSVWR